MLNRIILFINKSKLKYYTKSEIEEKRRKEWKNIHEFKFIRNRYLHISANDSMGMETNRPDGFTSMKRTIIADNA